MEPESKKKWNTDKAQVYATRLTFVALLVVIYQTYLAREQYTLQEKATNRAWAAEQLATIYSNPPLPRHVRQEAVRAYLRLQQVLDGEVRLPSADLRGMNLADEVFTKADLTEAKMEQCVLNGADLTKAKLIRAELVGAELNGATLDKAELIGANLADAKLRMSSLKGADFRGARFSFVSHDLATDIKEYFLGAVALGANFEDAVFDSSTVFCKVNAEGARLGNTIGLELKNAATCTLSVNGSTILPPNLNGHKQLRQSAK